MEDETLDEWIYQQQQWTNLAEQVGEDCVLALASILSNEERECEIRDASMLLTQLIMLDATTRYLSPDSRQHDARRNEARKQIGRTVRGLLQGSDQAEYLQGLSRWLGQYDRLGSVSVDDYRSIINLVIDKESLPPSTPFLSDLVFHVERLADTAYSTLQKIAGTRKPMPPSGSGRIKFGDGKSVGSIPTRRLPKPMSVAAETVKSAPSD